jgi:hypothetical protein
MIPQMQRSSASRRQCQSHFVACPHEIKSFHEQCNLCMNGSMAAPSPPHRRASISPRRGAGRYVRGDLRLRPAATSAALALLGIMGALLGGLMAGGLEGVCLGVECGLTRGYTRAAEVAAHRAGLAEARRRPEWVAQAEAAEAALQAALNMSPGRVEELRSARSL